MASQRKLVDGIRSLSPSRESWLDKPAEALPAKVTVEFKTGEKAFLDVRNPRAAHWARRIEKLQRANQPVYVEIDNETGVITNVRVPRRFTVERLDPDDYGNLLVRLRPSSAIHECSSNASVYPRE